MKIYHSDAYKYMLKQQLIKRIKYGNGVIKGGAFYLPEYKGDGVMDILNKVIGAVGTVADVISGSTKIYKSIRGKGNGIEEEALNLILAADTKAGTGDARDRFSFTCHNGNRIQSGNGFYFINSKETSEVKK